MEIGSALKIFRRSQQDRDVQYVNLLGDGDSRTYKTMVKSKPYRQLAIKDLECINHIQKRMDSRLRRMKQQLGNKKIIRRPTNHASTDRQIHRLTDTVLWYGHSRQQK